VLDPDMTDPDYANPDRLVTASELDERRGDEDVAVIEVDVDTTLYEKAHVPEAVGWSWTEDLNHSVRRDVVSGEGFEELARQAGVDPDTTVLLYGDNHNWFAAFALWLFEYYGHDDVALVDGGRDAITRADIELTSEVPEPAPGSFEVTEIRDGLRATREQVLDRLEAGEENFVDVRSPEEFSGELVAPPDLDETAQRGGHIPGATNVPWSEAVDQDGTFRPREELEQLYGPVLAQDETIAYCRIGERSAHSWFVLRHLLGDGGAANYDGSWTEYGNLIGVPVETGE
jgi:thiosulfate/3-mercaptopyruvate sulfurtransferase